MSCVSDIAKATSLVPNYVFGTFELFLCFLFFFLRWDGNVVLICRGRCIVCIFLADF